MKTSQHGAPRAWMILLAVALLASACQVRDLRKPDPKPVAAPEEAAPEAQAPPAHQNLHATLWVQTSVEYQAVTRQSYAQATARLGSLLKAREQTAAPVDQTGDFKNLPPAVILDVDETVLDNSPYQARLIADGGSFDPATWGQWVQQELATAVPGAVEFTQAAAAMGVTVFYVTNRTSDLELATRNNLKALGFPIDEKIDTVLTKGEQDDWASAKGTRRAFIARQHRIVMMVGDNLGDFVDGYKVSISERQAIMDKNQAMWGDRWIMLPNPTYGSWESALCTGSSSPEDCDRLKRGSLRLER